MVSGSNRNNIIANEDIKIGHQPQTENACYDGKKLSSLNACAQKASDCEVARPVERRRQSRKKFATSRTRFRRATSRVT